MQPSSNLRAEDVIAWADDCWGRPCPCGQELVGTDAVLSLLLGYKSQPRCIPCLAREHEEEPSQLVQRSLAHMQRLDCYRAGWEYAQARLTGAQAEPQSPSGAAPTLAPGHADSDPVHLHAADTWDAGDMGCGDLVLELRVRLAELDPGAVLQVRATDPGAPEDLPAWCRITKNPLRHTQHPHYWIQRREARVDS